MEFMSRWRRREERQREGRAEVRSENIRDTVNRGGTGGGEGVTGSLMGEKEKAKVTLVKKPHRCYEDALSSMLNCTVQLLNKAACWVCWCLWQRHNILSHTVNPGGDASAACFHTYRLQKAAYSKVRWREETQRPCVGERESCHIYRLR